jgi:hypothetical protein
MASLSQIINDYLAGPALIRQAVAGMTREQVLARPVPGKWSTLEVVCHLADFEPILADRMKRVIALDRPALLGADENRFAAGLAYHARDLDEELNVIEQTRRQMARILTTVAPEVLSRVGVHNERGPLTLEQLLAAPHVTSRIMSNSLGTNGGLSGWRHKTAKSAMTSHRLMKNCRLEIPSRSARRNHTLLKASFSIPSAYFRSPRATIASNLRAET